MAAAQAAVLGVAEGDALKPQGGRAAQMLGRRRRAVCGEVAPPGLDQVEMEDFLMYLLPEPCIRADEGGLATHHQGGVVATEPREVADVVNVADQNAVQL